MDYYIIYQFVPNFAKPGRHLQHAATLNENKEFHFELLKLVRIKFNVELGLPALPEQGLHIMDITTWYQ